MCGCSCNSARSAVDPDIATAPYSLRECCKQLVLLEDHLAHPNKRCPDCIHKHRLTAEAFAEEALTLDGARRVPEARSLPHQIRSCRTHQEARAIRKRLTSALRSRGLGGVSFSDISNLTIGLLGAANAFYATWSSADLAKEALKVRREGVEADKAVALEQIAYLKSQLEAQQGVQRASTGLSVGLAILAGVALLALLRRR